MSGRYVLYMPTFQINVRENRRGNQGWTTKHSGHTRHRTKINKAEKGNIEN